MTKRDLNWSEQGSLFFVNFGVDMKTFVIVLVLLMVVMGISMLFSLFEIVLTLRKRGFASTMLLFFLPSDLKKYKQLINAENNDNSKKQMKMTYYSFIISALIGFTCICIIPLILFIIF